mgnify:CR=1 FL=1
MDSLWVAKTGLEAQQTRMSVVSNNLANVNTIRCGRFLLGGSSSTSTNCISAPQILKSISSARDRLPPSCGGAGAPGMAMGVDDNSAILEIGTQSVNPSRQAYPSGLARACFAAPDWSMGPVCRPS